MVHRRKDRAINFGLLKDRSRSRYQLRQKYGNLIRRYVFYIFTHPNTTATGYLVWPQIYKDLGFRPGAVIKQVIWMERVAAHIRAY